MNSMPTHAFSSANQVANTYASNPQALQQRTNPPPTSGIKPELIDLIALQKIQAQQKMIANQMAMQNGMNQPTVADSLKQQVVNTEKQSLVDEASKNAGLKALMTQSTAGSAPPPQQAPQGGPPQQPPQQVVQAAEGGLMRIPTNLPDHYARGGIIAFAGDDEDVGSSVPYPDDNVAALDPSQVSAAADRESEMMRAIKAPFRAMGNTLQDVYTEEGSDEKKRLKALIEKNKLEQAAKDEAKKDEERSGLRAAMRKIESEKKDEGNRISNNSPSDARQKFLDFTLAIEGGDVANDNGKGKTRYGINSSANPNVDLDKLTPDGARQIYSKNYWDAIGGDELAKDNPAYARVLADAAVNQGQSWAAKAHGEAQGDINKLMELRRNRYKELAESSPDTHGKQLPGWMNRLSKLEKDISLTPSTRTARDAGQQPYYDPSSSSNAAASAPVSELESETSNYIVGKYRQKPEDVRAAEREEYLRAADPSYKLAMEQQKAGLARLQQLQEQARENRPNDWMAMLSRIGSNAGFAGAGLAGVLTGVGEAPARARGAAIQQDMEYETQIQALQKQMTDAMHNRDMGAYKQAFDAKKELEKSQDQMTTPAASIINSKTQAETNRIARAQMDDSRAATLAENERKNLAAAEAKISDDYTKLIEESKKMMVGDPNNTLYKQSQARVAALVKERDDRLRQLYADYGKPLPKHIGQQSASAATTGKVFSYNTGKPI